MNNKKISGSKHRDQTRINMIKSIGPNIDLDQLILVEVGLGTTKYMALYDIIDVVIDEL